MKKTKSIKHSAFKIKRLLLNRRTALLLAAPILAWLPGQTLNASDCVKQVFNRYCLGGESQSELAGIMPSPEAEMAENGEQLYTLEDKGKIVILKSSADGITTEVTRREVPGGWINFTAWKVKLVRLYGRGTELSNFPAYAGSRSSRLNAINAGRGHVEFAWDQPGYTVKLIWDHPDFIKLQYLLTSVPPDDAENAEGL